MVNTNNVTDIENLIDKKINPLKGQIIQLQTELIAIKKTLNKPVVGLQSKQLCGICDSVQVSVDGQICSFCISNAMLKPYNRNQHNAKETLTKTL